MEEGFYWIRITYVSSGNSYLLIGEYNENNGWYICGNETPINSSDENDPKVIVLSERLLPPA